MDFLYYFVTQSKYWDKLYHDNFFNVDGAFFTGLIIALIAGLLGALIFYIWLNRMHTVKYAKTWIWVTCMLSVGIISFVSADFGVIGMPNKYDRGFYYSNEQYYLEKTQDKQNRNQQESLLKKKESIKQDLDSHQDVRWAYGLTTAGWTLLFYYLLSLFLKRFSLHAKSIPCKSSGTKKIKN